jgi:ADP-ribose pyrophosphatase
VPGDEKPPVSDVRLPPGWEFVESVVEYETGWYVGGHDRLVQPDGTEKRYYWAELPPAVVVLARDGDELVMIEQYRPAIRRHCLELVAGIVEPADGRESADEAVPPAAYERAAGRELEEEAGVVPGRTIFLEDFWCSTGVLRHRRGHAFATELSAGERSLDTNEFIDVVRVPVDGALARIREEPANDATVEGLLLAREEGLL